MDDPRDQPPLPFDPAVDLVQRTTPEEPVREVSFDALTSLLFEEFAKRSAAARERESRA
jgi:hypothetical protein